MSADLLSFALLISLIALLAILRYAESRRQRITMLEDWLCLKEAGRKPKRNGQTVLGRF